MGGSQCTETAWRGPWAPGSARAPGCTPGGAGSKEGPPSCMHRGSWICRSSAASVGTGLSLRRPGCVLGCCLLRGGPGDHAWGWLFGSPAPRAGAKPGGVLSRQRRSPMRTRVSKQEPMSRERQVPHSLACMAKSGRAQLGGGGCGSGGAAGAAAGRSRTTRRCRALPPAAPTHTQPDTHPLLAAPCGVRAEGGAQGAGLGALGGGAMSRGPGKPGGTHLPAPPQRGAAAQRSAAGACGGRLPNRWRTAQV